MKRKPNSSPIHMKPQISLGSADVEPTHRPRVSAEIEAGILEIAFTYPTHGQDRVARDLRADGRHVSASGVRYVWQRHNLETIGKRVRLIEERIGRRDDAWSVEQLIARSRVRTDRKARSMAASIVGQDAGEVSRGTYILAVAARLLREKGYDATSLRDIAQRAHIPIGSMYYHFQTKDDLFASVYEEGINRITDAVKQAIASGQDPWQRLEQACITHLHHLCGGDDFTAVSIPTNLPRIEGAVKTRLTQLNDGYEDVFRKLILDLDLPRYVEPSLIRLQLLGALNWTHVWYKPGKRSTDDIARNLVYTLREGLDGKATRRSERKII